MEFRLGQIEALGKQLEQAKGRHKRLLDAVHNICKMFKKRVPLSIISDQRIIIVSETEINVETNVM